MIVSCSWDDSNHTDFELIRFLESKNIQCTFYLRDNLIKDHWNVYRSQEIGNHTKSHVNLVELNSQEMQDEIEQQNQIIKDHFNITPTSFAFPYGKFTQRDLDYCLWKFSFVRTICGAETNDPRTLVSDACIEDEDFWEKYDQAEDFFCFYGHSHHITIRHIKCVFNRLILDGCKFVVHSEFLKRKEQ